MLRKSYQHLFITKYINARTRNASFVYLRSRIYYSNQII